MKPLHLIAGAFCTAAGLIAPSTTIASPGVLSELILQSTETAPVATEGDGTYEVARRGRGRGRGGDRDRDRDHDRDHDHDHDHDDDDRGRDRDRDRDDDGSSGRDRPRIPGGSGCDDPGDVAEHPECRV